MMLHFWHHIGKIVILSIFRKQGLLEENKSSHFLQVLESEVLLKKNTSHFHQVFKVWICLNFTYSITLDNNAARR